MVTASADGMAAVRTARGVENVVTALIDPVAAGELVLVHAGTAISRIEEDALMSVDDEPTNFLYPFIDAQEDDPGIAAGRSGRRLRRRKPPGAWHYGARRWRQTPTCWIGRPPRRRAGSPAGGRMFTFGNGGSCRDSTTLAGLFAGRNWQVRYRRGR